MTNEEFIARMEEEIKCSIEALKEASKTDPNCYAAGYEAGYCDALRYTIAVIRGEED